MDHQESKDITTNRCFEEIKKRLFAHQIYRKDLPAYEAVTRWYEHCRRYKYPFINLYEKRIGHALLTVTFPQPGITRKLGGIIISPETSERILNLLETVPCGIDYRLSEDGEQWKLQIIRTRKPIPTTDAFILAANIAQIFESAGCFPPPEEIAK